MVRIREVGPRDGFQNEPEVIPTEEKVRLIRLLGEAGLMRIELTSFVRPDVIPQLADAEQVLAPMAAWHYSTGSIAVDNITSRKNEIFYWVTILVSNTLGTALGDFVATDTGLGFERGALVFAGLIALVAAVHFFTSVPDSVLFWAAYVLTRPLGATLGDTITKPHLEGGLEIGRIIASLVLAAGMVVIIALAARRDSNVVELDRVEGDHDVVRPGEQLCVGGRQGHCRKRPLADDHGMDELDRDVMGIGPALRARGDGDQPAAALEAVGQLAAWVAMVIIAPLSTADR